MLLYYSINQKDSSYRSTPSVPNKLAGMGDPPLTFDDKVVHMNAIALLIALDPSYIHIYNMLGL